MNWSNNLYLRWAATAAIVLLLIVIGLRWLNRDQPNDDATALLSPAPDAGVAALEPATSEQAPAELSPQPVPSIAAAGDLIAVDVIGAVMAPGVYRLAPSARIDDAVSAAGGLAPDANRERINLAAQLEDGAQIRVPRVDDVAADADAAPAQPAQAPAEQAGAGLVDINTADAAALEQLPGIGPATAEAIVAYREANGLFAAVEDLQNVKGIGPSLFAKLADLVVAGS